MVFAGNIKFCSSRMPYLLLFYAGGNLERGGYFVVKSLFFNLFWDDFSRWKLWMFYFFYYICSCYLIFYYFLHTLCFIFWVHYWGFCCFFLAFFAVWARTKKWITLNLDAYIVVVGYKYLHLHTIWNAFRDIFNVHLDAKTILIEKKECYCLIKKL